MTSDPRDVYGTSFECECGRTHVITPRSVVLADDAIARMPSACAELTTGRSCAIIEDRRTRAVAGDAVAEAMTTAGWSVRRLLLEDRGGRDPVCDDVTHAELLPEIGGLDLLVPVGSGVINDLGKWLAHDGGAAYATFATAASMNGYTSANVAPTIAGVKSLVRAQPPELVFSSPEVIAAAPHEMTVAGLGDVLAKSVSSADWYLNHALFGDFYCARSVDLVTELEPLYLDRPEAIRAHDPAALAAMFDALMLTGVAMTMAQSSAPASGGEHLISHSLDMLASIDAIDHDFHGRQVGVGTILTSELYRRVLALESPQWRDPVPGIDTRVWAHLWREVEQNFEAKRERLRTASARLREADTWDRLRETLAGMVRPPEQLHACLKAAGGAVTTADIGCDVDRLATAFMHGHEIRSRFTILDLALLTGVMPGAAHEIIEQWSAA